MSLALIRETPPRVPGRARDLGASPRGLFGHATRPAPSVACPPEQRGTRSAPRRLGAFGHGRAADRRPVSVLPWKPWIAHDFCPDKNLLTLDNNVRTVILMNTANMIANDLILLAKQNIGSGTMVSSARLCLEDAFALLRQGDDRRAAGRAYDSLRYSVGCFHDDDQKARELLDRLREAA